MRPVLLAVVLVACGRAHFAELPDANTDDAAHDAASAFVPSAGTCLEAGTGPFGEVASFPTVGGGYGVWAEPPFVLAADTTGGLTALRFDGASLAQTGHLDDLGWVEAVWSDGVHHYVGAPGTGLAVVDLDGGTGALTLRTQNTAISEARRGWSTGGRHYVPSGGAGLYAVQFDGTTLGPVGSPLPTMAWSQGVWASGNRVYFADASYFRIVEFDGTAFTDVVAPDGTHPGASRIWSDGTLIFVAHGGGVTAYRFDGTTLTDLDTFVTAASARDVWSDGLHVFVAAEGDGLYALGFAGDRFTPLDHVSLGTQALGVMGDGTTIFANDLTGGVHAYRGFACLRW